MRIPKFSPELRRRNYVKIHHHRNRWATTMFDHQRLSRLLQDNLGLTQSTLSARSGINQGTISKYLSGNMTPTVDQLDRLLRAAGIGLDQWGTGEFNGGWIWSDWVEPEAGDEFIRQVRPDARYEIVIWSALGSAFLHPALAIIKQQKQFANKEVSRGQLSWFIKERIQWNGELWRQSAVRSFWYLPESFFCDVNDADQIGESSSLVAQNRDRLALHIMPDKEFENLRKRLSRVEPIDDLAWDGLTLTDGKYTSLQYKRNNLRLVNYRPRPAVELTKQIQSLLQYRHDLSFVRQANDIACAWLDRRARDCSHRRTVNR